MKTTNHRRYNREDVRQETVTGDMRKNMRPKIDDTDRTNKTDRKRKTDRRLNADRRR